MTDGPTIRRHPADSQRFVVEYRNCIYGPYTTLQEAQQTCAELPKGLDAIERGYTESPTYRKLKRQTARTRLAASNPANQKRRARIRADLAGFHHPCPPLQTRQPNCDDWMTPFVLGPGVLPKPGQVRRWQTGARAAAIEYRRTIHNRARQPKASAKGAEVRRRQGRKTAEEVSAAVCALRADGIPSRQLAAIIAAKLHLTARQVRNILKAAPALKGKYPRSV